MNPAKKAYCRTFQFFSKLALPLMPYREPQVLHSAEELAAVLHQQQKSCAQIVCGKSALRHKLVNPLIDALADKQIKCVIFDQTTPNPTIECIEAARAQYVSQNCEAIIGFGGGSPIDCAKGVAARIARPDKRIQDMKGLLKIRKKTPLLVAVPTTAGSGSETTVAAVITDEQTHHKYPVNDFVLIPSYALLDYKNTLDLPAFTTATTGMDALTHAVEAYIGHATTAHTWQAAEEATRLIVQNLPLAYTDRHNTKARAAMQKAAYLAGVAFTRSYVGYVHAIAHSLGGKYNVAHGLANAVILPKVLKAYGKSAQAAVAKLSRKSGICSPDTPDASAAKKFIQWIEHTNAQMKIPSHIPELRKENIPELAKTAEKEANPLYPVPKLLDAKELEGVYLRLV